MKSKNYHNKVIFNKINKAKNIQNSICILKEHIEKNIKLQLSEELLKVTVNSDKLNFPFIILEFNNSSSTKNVNNINDNENENYFNNVRFYY